MDRRERIEAEFSILGWKVIRSKIRDSRIKLLVSKINELIDQEM